jgi:hypothetical protein
MRFCIAAVRIFTSSSRGVFAGRRVDDEGHVLVFHQVDDVGALAAGVVLTAEDQRDNSCLLGELPLRS